MMEMIRHIDLEALHLEKGPAGWAALKPTVHEIRTTVPALIECML
jgi:hypothetical protein